MDELHRQQSQSQLDLPRVRLRSLDRFVEAAAVFWSAARGELDTDSDLLVIATNCRPLRRSRTTSRRGALGRPVNLVLFAPEPWRAACGSGHPFPQNIFARPIISLVGELRRADKQVL